MLLRYGVIAMSFSVVVTLVLVAILVIRDRPEEVVTTESAAASPEPTTEQVYQDPRDKMLDLPSPEPEPRSEQPESAFEPEPESESVSQPDPAPESVWQGEPAPKADPEPRKQSSCRWSREIGRCPRLGRSKPPTNPGATIGFQARS